MGKKQLQTQEEEFTCQKCGSHFRMYNSTNNQFECATCYTREAMTDSLVESVIKVLVEKYDNGKKTSRYKYGNRVFIITLKEKKSASQIGST